MGDIPRAVPVDVVGFHNHQYQYGNHGNHAGQEYAHEYKQGLLAEEYEGRATVVHKDSLCDSCCRKAFCSRHNITWVLLASLLGSIGYFLLIYAVPLMDKAHEVADEALDITGLARDKLESIDKQVGDFLQGGNEKLESVDEQIAVFLGHGTEQLIAVGEAAAAVQVLTVRLHTIIDELNATNTKLQAQIQQTPPPVDGVDESTIDGQIPSR